MKSKEPENKFWIFDCRFSIGDIKNVDQRLGMEFRSALTRKSKIQNRKWVGIALVVAFVMCGAVVEAQQARKTYRIGYMSGRSGPGPLDDVFKSALRELGYVEGQNIAITYRWAEEKLDRLPSLAVELAQLNVDVIVTETTPAARAAKKATTTIPIVMALSADAVGTGLLASLARPGANITGLTFIGSRLGRQIGRAV